MVRRWCGVATVVLVCIVACGTVLAVAAANTASSDKLIRIPIASTPTRRLARQYQYDVKLVTQHTYAGERKKVLIAGKRYVNPTRERQSPTLCERACVLLLTQLLCDLQHGLPRRSVDESVEQHGDDDDDSSSSGSTTGSEPLTNFKDKE